MTTELPKLETTTLWDYPHQSYGATPKGNNKFQGVTPAFVIWNLIQRYTKPGDIVVDPMAGSGTAVDVCDEEGRKCLAFDINPQHPKIIKNDSRIIPIKDNSVDLVFIDPPYGDNVHYSDHPADIGHISAEDPKFYEELTKVAKEIYRILKPDGVLGWLIGDQWVKRRFTPVGFYIYRMLTEDVGFTPIDIICVVRRNQSSNTALWHYRAKKFNFFLRGFKYLFIMRKPLSADDSLRARLPLKYKWNKYK